MHLLSSSLSVALLCLSSISSILATPVTVDTQLISRQDTTISCAEYASIANLSAIDGNSTYRSAYLQASPMGTDPTRAPLDLATLKEPSLIFDKALNEKCGNLTTIALKEVEANFTRGIVGPFSMKSAAIRVGGSGMLGTVVMVASMVGVGLWL